MIGRDQGPGSHSAEVRREFLRQVANLVGSSCCCGCWRRWTC